LSKRLCMLRTHKSTDSISTTFALLFSCLIVDMKNDKN